VLILGIETSCDETAAAVVEASGGLGRPRFRIRSNVVSSQVKLHAKYGGVVPGLAAREHEKNLPIVANLALRSAAGKRAAPSPAVRLIAVTRGPGLEPCLWRGIAFAEDLAERLGVPILGVNHLEGHIYSNWLEPVRVITNYQLPITKRFKNRKIAFPAICLIVSGGHTELVLMKGCGNYTLLGSTRDDAVGEAYDKVARLLGLGYPGGPAIDALASIFKFQNSNTKIRLPRPMLRTKNYDFSFAGLKTAVLYLLRDLKATRKKIPVEAICAEFQQAVIDVLVEKTLRAARNFRARSIMVSGGVSANSGLRSAFATVSNFSVLFPPKELTTDNAAMIAMAGYFNWMRGMRSNTRTLDADANLRIV
jgi:N6-L-threonylcarbamoyladenine synthase